MVQHRGQGPWVPILAATMLLALLFGLVSCDPEPEPEPGWSNRGMGPANPECPHLCRCTDDSVRCFRVLFRIPHNIPSSTKKLYLSGSKITNLTRLDLPNIVSLSLANTGLTNIHSDAFIDTLVLESLDLSYNQLTKLSRKFFQHLSNLKVLQLNNNLLNCIDSSIQDLIQLEILYLHNNQLKTIAPNSFTHMKNLKRLRLENNQFHCSCQMGWLAGFLRRAPDLGLGTLCSSPDRFDGRSVATILPHQLDCSEPELEEVNCMERVMKCPDRCRCSNGVVDCRSLGLTDIPEDVPFDTEELRLEKNFITKIPDLAFYSAPNIKRIDLSRNSISQVEADAFKPNKELTTLILYDNDLKTLPKNVFRGLTQLHMVLLNKNKLQCIPANLFKDQEKLVLLSLYDNQLETLPKNLFLPLKSIKSIHLGMNPWDCSCELKWLSTYLSYRYVETSGASCNTPAKMNKKPLSTAIIEPCTHDNRHSDRCSQQDCPINCECSGSLVDCSGARNSSTPANASLYDITHLLRTVSPSTKRIVLNSHQVKSCRRPNKRTNFRCECEAGWEGELCDQDRNDCHNHACRNGGICLDRLNSYECECKPGFSGQFCQQMDLEATNAVCADNLCQNHGQCVPDVESLPGYKCLCQFPFSGTFCQEYASVSLMYQSTSPCTQHDCIHGECHVTPMNSGTALSPGYTCSCHPGYSGKRCEYLTSVRLGEKDSRMELDPLFTARPVNLTFVVKTDQKFGVLLYHGDRSHLAIELFHGRIRASFNLGDNPAATMFSYTLLNDDMDHRVNFLLEGKVLTMSVDGESSRSMVSQGQEKMLHVQKPTYLGGVPSEVGEVALGRWHLRNDTSFKGCIKEFFLNGKQIDFLQAARVRQGVQPGCSLEPPQMSPRTSSDIFMSEVAQLRLRDSCDGNKCRDKGTRKCRARGDKDYSCKCKRGWDGRYCEKAPTCRKRKKRVVPEENNCRARRSISVHRCQGECHDSSCCQAKKLRTKRVAMVCNDGTRYLKLIKMPKKCSCKKGPRCSKQRGVRRN